MECYNFYQQCKDYFFIARAKSAKRILFDTSFFGIKLVSAGKNSSRNKTQIALFQSRGINLKCFSIIT